MSSGGHGLSACETFCTAQLAHCCPLARTCAKKGKIEGGHLTAGYESEVSGRDVILHHKVVMDALPCGSLAFEEVTVPVPGN